MRVALLTGTSLRHKYIAHKLGEAMDLALVVSEEKSAVITSVEGLNEADRELLKNHFIQREKNEEEYFGQYIRFPKQTKCIPVSHGNLHTLEVQEALIRYQIEALALFGCSIVKEPILKLFRTKTVNLHLGLSPYYRGSGTNFFPLLYGQPEFVGATFHLATASVDAGGILHQFRLDNITEEDTIHTLGNKVIQKAGILYPAILSGYLSGTLQPKKPEISQGKLFQVRDFTPDVYREVQRSLPKHLKSYLENKDERNQKVSIIEASSL